MASSPHTSPGVDQRIPLGALRVRWADLAPWIVAAAAFVTLFAGAAASLGRDWWSDPEAGHGLLLAPVAFWLAWRRRPAAPRPEIGRAATVLVVAVLLRWMAGVAVEYFTLRLSMLLALAGLTIAAFGLAQLRRWWLPFVLLLLSIPLPQVVLGHLALPLQLLASRMGAVLLHSRHVPVVLTGNVLHLPGRDLFVTEACSGLRSLTALLSLGVLLAGTTLRRPVLRAVLLAAAIPVAVLLNAVRVFLTGFLVYSVSPAFGDGFLHYTEGWALFLGALAWLGVLAWAGVALERRLDARSADA